MKINAQSYADNLDNYEMYELIIYCKPYFLNKFLILIISLAIIVKRNVYSCTSFYRRWRIGFYDEYIIS